MGVHLVELLAAEEIDLFITSRSSKESKDNIIYIKGNAKDLNFIEPIINKKWDVIIDFMVYTTEMFRDRYHLFLNNSFQYIFLSSARVYADSNKLLNEKSQRLLNVTTDKTFLETDESESPRKFAYADIAPLPSASAKCFKALFDSTCPPALLTSLEALCNISKT